MKIFEYFIFSYARPCSHYIPRRRKRKLKRMTNLNRLTIVDDLGNWQLRGVRWRDLYVGEVITSELNCRLYAALSKLLDYEVTGLSPEEVEKLKEKAGEVNG